MTRINISIAILLTAACCALIGLMASTRACADADTAKRLIITKAVYGDLPDGASVDVTEKVAVMVKDNALSVDATNEHFGDPAEHVVKKLRVDYTIEGVAASKTVAENETLTISADEKPASSTTKPVSSKLVIRKAVYGDLPDGDKFDVTEKVAAMVKDNSLSVEASNDNFGNPAKGFGKKLQVDYTINGLDRSKTVDGGQTLTISNTGE